ncbi:MAG TPA: isoprenylcysteine carboxylmethyltransferase family protein [Thermoanaerobaculia bacterium]|nr:isoprenylcysteine carboxylmethyltransferase family protein [Thermoanaerobaculia bacterium]
MSAESDSEEAANPGFVRPPQIYLIAILGGIGLDLLRPLRWLPGIIGPCFGVPLVIAALAIFLTSTNRFKAAGTPVPGDQPTTRIVRSGPYRFSRNPIYLSFSLLVLGIAFWRNSVWLLGTLAVAVGLMSFIVIPREERYLERRFGPEYLGYKMKVRRWL